MGAAAGASRMAIAAAAELRKRGAAVADLSRQLRRRV